MVKKQKMKKKINHRLWIFAGLVLLALLIFSLKWSGVIDNSQPSDTATNNTPTTEQKQAESQADANVKKTFIEGQNSKTEEPSTSQQQTGSASLELSATRDNSTAVTVISKLHNIGAGSCTLVTTNGQKQDKQTAEIIYQPEYSTCAGFSIPVSELGNGNWTIVLTVNSNGQVYSKTINFNVQ